MTNSRLKNVGKGHGRHFIKHGMWKSPEYHTWQDMKARCLRPSHKSYKDYGGRGITICDRWLDFPSFYEDMGKRPDKMSLDRINNDLGYSPENCRWTTQLVQTGNTRRNNWHVGVHLQSADGYWIAKLRGAYLGRFKSFDEALKARKEAENA